MHMSSSPAIRYLYDAAQENGTLRDVVPGLQWLRLPLPFVLNHVNVWLLRDGNAFTLVDTGADKPETRATLERIIAAHPLRHLIATHGHPDHIGLAGWIVERTGVPLSMTLAEWLAPQVWREEGLKALRPEVEAFWRRNGLAEAGLTALRTTREKAQFRSYPMPAQFQRLRDGDTVTFGERDWQVLVNGGHADEHASFYCSAERILIAGDQVLSKITPVVGVFPSQPEADPLADYFASLDRLAALPQDTLVLPSHGLPFHGLHARLAALREHHTQRLDALLAHMTEPKTGFQLAEGLFARAIAEGQNVLAMAETLAHAHRLVGMGLAAKSTASDGRILFTRT